uniref:1-acylglycerol-3-phosphate O-acyltransferase n=1 Tax=Anas platyrhynchos platyrhynchos TaxID=8840 RepID=U3I8P6_ANAPP
MPAGCSPASPGDRDASWVCTPPAGPCGGGEADIVPLFPPAGRKTPSPVCREKVQAVRVLLDAHGPALGEAELCWWLLLGALLLCKLLHLPSWQMAAPLPKIALLLSDRSSLLFPRIIKTVVRTFKYFFGLRFEVKGLENFEVEGPAIIVSNHQSILDMMGLMEVLPDNCVQVGKKELMYAGTVGLIIYLGGVIFINRKSTSSAKMVMAEVAKTMATDNVSVAGVAWG